ncbi:MAG: PASTA domain-containing protein [Bacteroidales bacterium]|nr:PASTA domain-containing protein [Bacteroidales bacterium]
MANKKFMQSRRVLVHILLAMLASALIVMLVFMVLKSYGRVGREYTMPYVVDRFVNELDSDNELNLRYVIIDSVYEEGKPGGLIKSQDPDSGSMVKTGRKVYLIIYSYVPEDAVMPDVTSLSVRLAIAQLENVGLHGGRLIGVHEPAGVVIEQRYKGKAVEEGRKLSKGSNIDLVIGMGGDSTRVVVPYVVGQKPAKARRDILAAGLNVGSEHFDGVSDMSHAIVYRQSPEYSGRPSAGLCSSVELYYCDKSLVKMEDLERMKRKHIEDSIRAAEEMGRMFEISSEYDLVGLDAF